MNSEPHRNALLKVLNQAYVDKDVSVDKLGRLVNNITMDNYISFSDDEIPLNGRGSVKALNITVDCKGYMLPDVLVDNGSSLNVMPLTTLMRLPIETSYMRTSSTVVRAFDGTRREVVGKIDIPIRIGPGIYNIEFQVMDITPNYNCLLGRPWIHSAGAVPSSLHQKLKFIIDNKVISVGGEEDIIAVVSPDAPYIEVSEDTVECSFRSLEFINATFITEGGRVSKPKLSRNTKMGIKLTVGKGARARKGLGKSLQGMTRALWPKGKTDRFGLGFEPDSGQKKREWLKNRERRKARVSGRAIDWEPLVFPPLRETFRSAGHIFQEEKEEGTTTAIERTLLDLCINMMGGEDEFGDKLSKIRPIPPGYMLYNWTVSELPQSVRSV